MGSVRDFWSIPKLREQHDIDFWKEIDKANKEAKKDKNKKKKDSGVR